MPELRKCTCRKRPHYDEKPGLEIACVMDGVWCVLCHNCGALSYHGVTKAKAVKLWDHGKLQREVGYFFSRGGYVKAARRMGKQIARAAMQSH